jgi:hypothetical protein
MDVVIAALWSVGFVSLAQLVHSTSVAALRRAVCCGLAENPSVRTTLDLEIVGSLLTTVAKMQFLSWLKENPDKYPIFSHDTFETTTGEKLKTRKQASHLSWLITRTAAAGMPETLSELLPFDPTPNTPAS